jgi:hypothetical protein
MGLNYSALVYEPSFDLFARPITVNPLASQPGAPTYSARGIYHSDGVNVAMEDGSILSDQLTSLDILEAEFPVIPVQLDRIVIGQDGPQGMPALGEFEITSSWSNGGGETNLILRKWLPPAP